MRKKRISNFKREDWGHSVLSSSFFCLVLSVICQSFTKKSNVYSYLLPQKINIQLNNKAPVYKTKCGEDNKKNNREWQML